MAPMLLTGCQLLTELTLDLGMRFPTYKHDLDVRGLTKITVTIHVDCRNGSISEKTLTSISEDNIIIAEDIASRMISVLCWQRSCFDPRCNVFCNDDIVFWCRCEDILESWSISTIHMDCHNNLFRSLTSVSCW